MNQIATQQPKPMLAAGGAIAAIVPQDIAEAFRLSEAISQSGMAPYGLDSPQKVMIAMLAGMELGMPPMQAVQSVAVINNRPCIWGDALIGMVRAFSGCESIKEWLEGDGDDMVAYCETKRRDQDETIKRTFSVADAKKAGLWQTEARVTRSGRNGSYEKDNDSPWFKYPQRMLQMRARAWCLRDAYGDVLKGMQVREEVQDYPARNAKDITPSARPSVSERFSEARAPLEHQEGFDVTHVRQEVTDAAEVLVTAEQSHQPNPDPTSSPDQDADPDASPRGQDSAEGGDHPPASPPSPLIRCCKDFLVTAGDERLTPKQRRETLAKVKDRWKVQIDEADHDKMKSFLDTANAILKGDTSLESAVMHFAGVLDCAPEDIGGQTP